MTKQEILNIMKKQNDKKDRFTSTKDDNLIFKPKENEKGKEEV